MQKRMAVSLSGTIPLVFFVLLLIGSQVNAQNNAQNNEQLTQAEFANILIGILGLGDQLPAAATLSDRVELLEELGYAPIGGWQPEVILTGGDVAVTLARMLRIGIPGGATSKEYIQALTHRSIMTSGSTERPFSLPDLTTAINMAVAIPHTITISEGSSMPAPRGPAWGWWRPISPRK